MKIPVAEVRFLAVAPNNAESINLMYREIKINGNRSVSKTVVRVFDSLFPCHYKEFGQLGAERCYLAEKS